MKTSRFVLWLTVAFVLGYCAHVGVTNYRIEQNRTALEEFYQTVFRPGESYEKVAASLKDKGLSLSYDPERHRFFTSLSADPTAGLHLYVEVDEAKQIQKVRVVRVFVQ